MDTRRLSEGMWPNQTKMVRLKQEAGYRESLRHTKMRLKDGKVSGNILPRVSSKDLQHRRCQSEADCRLPCPSRAEVLQFIQHSRVHHRLCSRR